MVDEPATCGSDERLERFTRHLAECQTQLFAGAFAVVQNMADAEDICQRSFVTLWRKYDLFQEGTNFYAWALKTTHYEALNFVRRRNRERLYFCEETIQALAQTQSERVGSDDHAAKSSILKECLKKLPKKQRQLIEMRYDRACTAGEIASTLNRTENAIRAALSRTRKALRECVERVHAEEKTT